ncbi:MAG: flagellar basal body P-ring formation protein FlgA [Burkholderiaceae bacterium]|nr:flagellar basal body P-ring formation protein FlgA [Burkholderiaceae bacterium]
MLSFVMTGGAFAQSAVMQTAALSPAYAQPSRAQPVAAPSQGPQVQNLDELAQIAHIFLTEQTKDLTGKTEITIHPLDARLRLTACEQPVPYLSQGARLWGRTTVAMRCDAPEPWRIMVKAHIRIIAPYLTTARTLPQGHVITAADLALANGDITAIRPGVLNSKEAAIGRTLVRAAQAGSPVWPEHLRAQKAVMQGQTVRIISKGQGFSISGEGYAISSADEGQVAKVKMANGNVIRGIARADGIIEVSF